jgi:hypothetical protein
MWGLLKDALFVLALLAALGTVAWYAEPSERFLHTGSNCHEISQHLAAKRYRDLSPAEETDMANCTY